MKYLFLLTILLSCKSEPKKVVAAGTGQDSSLKVPIQPDTNAIPVHDSYETGKDTVWLNNAMSAIFEFPEVKAINKQIDKDSKGTHGVSIMLNDDFGGDTAYYDFQVGDNSHDDRYLNIYDFLLEKKTGEIKVYDAVTDSILSLKDWRERR